MLPDQNALNAMGKICQPVGPSVVLFHNEIGVAVESHSSVFCRDGVQLGRKILFEPKQRRLEMICVENVIPRLCITYMYLKTTNFTLCNSASRIRANYLSIALSVCYCRCLSHVVILPQHIIPGKFPVKSDYRINRCDETIRFVNLSKLTHS